MSLAATLPQLPLPTTVTLDLKPSSPLMPCRDFSGAGDMAEEREEKREKKEEEEGEEEEEREGECEEEKEEEMKKIEKNDRIRMEDGE